MVRACECNELAIVWRVINDGANAYRGVIPEDCWHEPYMGEQELQSEMEQGVAFFAYEEQGHVLGVMGLQSVRDVALIRHAYVRTTHQRQGIGGKLLSALLAKCVTPVLVGTWADASWAVKFYEGHGFRLVDEKQKIQLLENYWGVPDRQIEASVVLIHDGQPLGNSHSERLKQNGNIISPSCNNANVAAGPRTRIFQPTIHVVLCDLRGV